MMDKINIIIPTYKPQGYLMECIDSIKNQTLDKTNYDVIIVLNGEKEPYFTEIEKHIKSRDWVNFKLYYTSCKGVSRARNIGLEKSNGDYICFIDDDDLISPTYLEELLSISNISDIGVSNLYTFTDTINKLGEDYITRKFKKKQRFSFSIVYNRKFLSAIAGKIISKKLIGNIRFNPNVYTGEDSLFLTEISKNIKHIKKTSNDVIYYRRIREGSLSRSKKYKNIKEIYILLKEYIGMFFSKGYDKLFILTRIIATLKRVLK